ncbi:MAG: hypothetical protein U5Q03_04655 [Bacteroidota bacterium]|nr:hypothetical protein [Bacteroidota bacterium]
MTAPTRLELNVVAPSKIIYILKDNSIVKSIEYIFYDEYLNSSYELEPDFREYLEKEKEKNKNGIESDASFVYGYIFSSAKYNGYIPIRKGFSISDVTFWLPYNESLKDSKYSIQNGIELYKMKN